MGARKAAGGPVPYKVKVSYAVRLGHLPRSLKRQLSATVDYHRALVAWLLPVVEERWEEIAAIQGDKERQRHVERLVHGTSRRLAAYPEFDERFHKCPSYLLREAVSSAIGAYSSWRSNHDDWAQGNRPGRGEPKLGAAPKSFPTLFAGNMYDPRDLGPCCAVKVRQGKDWEWRGVTLDKGDLAYIERHVPEGAKCSAPVLQRVRGKWQLRFAFEWWAELPDIDSDPASGLACAVDLGVGSAFCCVMDSAGSVLARRSIKLAKDKDRLEAVLAEVRKAQSQGAKRSSGLWQRANGINTQMSRQLAGRIVAFAAEHGCSVVVFEHLERPSKKERRRVRQRFQHWRCREVQRVAEPLAHRAGMRIRRVCARGSSQLAHDGSGPVERGFCTTHRYCKDLKNWKLCRFRNGKVYDADYNACLNIGARHWVRRLMAGLSDEVASEVQAKVPDASHGTRVTLDTLFRLRAVLPA